MAKGKQYGGYACQRAADYREEVDHGDPQPPHGSEGNTDDQQRDEYDSPGDDRRQQVAQHIACDGPAHFGRHPDAARRPLRPHPGQNPGSQLRALQELANRRQEQAASLAYFDVFWLCAALGVGLILLVLLMKRSVAEKGAHVGAE